MDIPVISFVALSSGTGKTTILERVIPILKGRGIRLAVLKHDVHGFEIDKPGKDTWRLAKAGADIVAISSAQKFAFIEKRDKELSLDEAVARIKDVDIVLTEGYKRENKDKILVYRSGAGSPSGTEDDINDLNELIKGIGNIIAIASDVKFQDIDFPQVNLEDYRGIADLIIKRINRA